MYNLNYSESKIHDSQYMNIIIAKLYFNLLILKK